MSDAVQDKYKRSMAENENVRRRSEIEVNNAKDFAIQKFAKDITPVADVLQAAINSITPEMRSASTDPNLATLYDGVLGCGSIADCDCVVNRLMLTRNSTHNMMIQVFGRNGIEVIKPDGEKFDPNKHEALCEVPDPSKATGMVAFVQKSGYSLKGRVIRPASVAVVRNA